MAQMDMGQVIALASLATSLANGACLLAQSYGTPEIIIDRVEGRR